MTVTATQTLTTAERRRGAPVVPLQRRRALHRVEARSAGILMLPYALLFLAAAAVPILYALWISFQKAPTFVDSSTGFGGLDAYITAVTDYRFIETFVNIFTVLIIWLPLMIVGVVGLALLVHASPGRFGGAMRFIYFLPGALAGIANFVLWVYLLNPSMSPIAFVWRGAGMDNLKEVVTAGNMPWILTAMLFFQGVGTWIVIVYGGLNGIPEEIFEAAQIDGANAWQVAWRIKIPLIQPWIGYAALMNLAYGFQLFLEPYLMRQISSGSIDAEWAPTQLGYAFAFTNRNFPAAAAISIILLIITLAIGMFIVFRSGLFGEEEKSK